MACGLIGESCEELEIKVKPLFLPLQEINGCALPAGCAAISQPTLRIILIFIFLRKTAEI